MFKLTIQGDNFIELKQAVAKLYGELVLTRERLDYMEELEDARLDQELADLETSVKFPIEEEKKEVAPTKKKRTRRKNVTQSKVEEVIKEMPVEEPITEEKVEELIKEVATPVEPFPPVPTPGYSLATFRQKLPLVIAELIAQGKIDSEYVKSLKEYFEVKEIMELFGQPEKIEELYNQFVNLNLIAGE